MKNMKKPTAGTAGGARKSEKVFVYDRLFIAQRSFFYLDSKNLIGKIFKKTQITLIRAEPNFISDEI